MDAGGTGVDLRQSAAIDQAHHSEDGNGGQQYTSLDYLDPSGGDHSTISDIDRHQNANQNNGRQERQVEQYSDKPARRDELGDKVEKRYRYRANSGIDA
jgi:hypothetical protein